MNTRRPSNHRTAFSEFRIFWALSFVLALISSLSIAGEKNTESEFVTKDAEAMITLSWSLPKRDTGPARLASGTLQLHSLGRRFYYRVEDDSLWDDGKLRGEYTRTVTAILGSADLQNMRKLINRLLIAHGKHSPSVAKDQTRKNTQDDDRQKQIGNYIGFLNITVVDINGSKDIEILPEADVYTALDKTFAFIEGRLTFWPHTDERAVKIAVSDMLPAENISFGDLLNNSSRLDGKRIAVIGRISGSQPIWRLTDPVGDAGMAMGFVRVENPLPTIRYISDQPKEGALVKVSGIFGTTDGRYPVGVISRVSEIEVLQDNADD